MRVDIFDFELPEERIALRPAEPRDAARMLVRPAAGAIVDAGVRDLPHWLKSGDALVVNDTRVIPAQLEGVRVRGETSAHMDVTLHKREAPNRWLAFVRPAKKLRIGERIQFGNSAAGNACMLGSLEAEVMQKGEGGEVLLAFDFAGAALDEAIERFGHMPLPPYIASKRGEDSLDERDYQTMFAREAGAVAAPTASLHFTPELVASLEARGVSVHRVTLHVGAGTFLPVKADDTDDHRMHAEYGIVSQATADALNEVHRHGGRIAAAGTTSLRILESAAAGDGLIKPFAGDTSIFITPGYRFRAVDILLTNFHLPKSTLFMLVSAFAGLPRMQSAYVHAITQKYRFYSYGDACLLFRQDGSPTGGSLTVGSQT